jgi:pilus assembly protein Flp/PilA
MQGERTVKLTVAIKRFLQDEDGPTAVEYAFMAVLILVACILAIVSLGQNTSGVFHQDSQKITGGS